MAKLNLKPLLLVPALLIALSWAPLIAAADWSAGEKLYRTHCGNCHGAGGEGAEGPTLAVPKLPRASTLEQMNNVILRGIPNTGMPRTRIGRDELRTLVTFVMHLGEVPAEPTPGDPTAGEKVYFAADCKECHAIRAKGGAMGPDLSKIGLSRSASHLRASLLAPDADVPKSFLMMRSDISIPENFLQVRLVPRGGEEIIGVRVNEDAFSIQVRDSANKLHSFFKSELAEFSKDWGKSPMPSYDEVYTPTELDDLVAFLVSLKGE